MPTALAILPLILLAACTAPVEVDAEPAQSSPSPAPPPARTDPAMIHYHVDLSERHAQRVHVAMSFQPSGDDEIAMPVWTPGSYLVREYARHVLDVEAVDQDGRAVPIRKVSKNSWRLEAGGAEQVTVRLSLWADERSVRTNHVDDRHAFLAPAGTFPFVRGRLDQPHRVTVDLPAGWNVYTGLTADGDGWLAADYDVLVDSPLEIGPHEEIGFDVHGVPHRIVLGEGHAPGDEEWLEELSGKLTAICNETVDIFGVIPFSDYTFILTFTDREGGGLEHMNSSVNMISRWRVGTEEGRYRLLTLLAHEYFHAWNVKRFRPAALGPFDYEAENYTTDLWVAEGTTSYYEGLIPVRSGVIPLRKPAGSKADAWFENLAKGFREVAERRGSDRTSLTASSWDTWIKQYRPDANSFNSTVSYYQKGELVSLMLDLHIRRTTDGERSLDDVLRLGWERYGARDVGYEDGAMEDLASEVSGTDLRGFFDDYVRGTTPLDPNPELAWVGLELAVTPEKTQRSLATDAAGFPLAPDLGIKTRDSDGLCEITRIVEDGPAYHAGLGVGDVILAVDDMRVTHDTLTDRLDRTAGEPVTLTLYRGQGLRRVVVRPVLEPLTTWKIVPLAGAGPAQQRAFEAWTGREFPASGD